MEKNNDKTLPDNVTHSDGAEGIISSPPIEKRALSSFSLEEIEIMVHDLSAQQSELESQNNELRKTQKELEKSRNKYTHLYEFAPVGYVTVSKKGIITEANHTITVMLRTDRNQVMGAPFSRFVVREDQALYCNYRNELLQTGNPSSITLKILQNREEWFYASLESIIIPAEAHNKRQIRIAVIDSQERIQYEQELLNGQQAWINTFNSISDWVSIIDVKSSTILKTNKAGEQLLKCSYNEIIGKSCWSLVHKTQGPIPECPLRKMLETGKSESAEYKTPEGKWYLESVDPIKDENNTIYNAVHIIRDITEKKHAEEKLRHSIINLKESVKAGHVGLWDWDLITNKVTFSTEWKRQIGFEEHEISNDFSEWEKRVHPDDLEATLKKFQQSINDVNPKHQSEFRFRHKDCSFRWILSQASLVKNKDGSPIRMVGSHLDITEQKKAAQEKHKLELRIQQSQKMEAIGTLAGGIAHDFNNILSPIIGFTEVITEDLPQNSPLQGFAHQVLSAALRAKDLVKQILMFSSKEEQQLKPVKLQSIIQEALKLLIPSLPATIDIRTEMDPDCGVVLTDPTQIHQIVMNLATNAYHAMQKTGGELKIFLNETQVKPRALLLSELIPRRYVLLKIIDTGTGIKKEFIDKIFDPYFTTKPKDEGTGLGLAVVKGIVKSYNGEIFIYSEPDKGTEVHIYLPLLEEAAEKEIVQPLDAVQRGVERILLVDDEEAIVKMEKMILERLGYQITSFTSSIEALQEFQANPNQFDLVFTDMTMPHMTGVQLANALKFIRSDIPVIICTGFSDHITAETHRLMGFQGYVAKPVLKHEMAQTIREALDKQKKDGGKCRQF